MENNKNKIYDFFISHASEDKEKFVRPLAEKLILLGYKVWYDEHSLKLGDSLLSGISDGIKNSKYGVIVLSKNFFIKTWTRKELEALINKEVLFEKNIILPVWLDISAQEIYDFSPLLSDKIAIKTSYTDIDSVISKIKEKTKINIIDKTTFLNKIHEIKNLNTDRRKKYILDIEIRIKNLFHFQQEYYNWFTSDDAFGDKDWDDIIAEEKRLKFQEEYNIPQGIWDNTELSVGPKMQILIKLGKKWGNRKMNCSEAAEFHFLMDEYYDIDPHYIMYGIPHQTIFESDLIDYSIAGLYTIGISSEVNEKDVKKAFSEAFDKYYIR